MRREFRKYFTYRFSIFVFLIIVLVCTIGNAQVRVIPRLQRDDFDKSHSWWEYHNEPTNATYQTKPQIMGGYLFMELKRPQFFGDQQMNNVGFENATIDQLYANTDTVFVRTRVRFLTPHQPGSRGFGWWYKEGVPITVNEHAWFMQEKEQVSSPTYSQDTWWRADKTNGLHFSTHDSVDLSPSYLTGWHTYEIYRYGMNRIEWYVDGTQVMVSDSFLPDNYYDYHHWIDNLVYHYTVTGPDQYSITVDPKADTTWSADYNREVVDFVEIIYGKNMNIGFTQTPTGILRLRDYPNEIAPGSKNYLWKSYTFNTDWGRTLIIATAKAEEYDTYGDADSLHMVIDGNDFGYGSKGWNGNVLQSATRIVVIDTILTAGSHTLKFYSSNTPILYDATVLNSATGKLLMDTTLNQTAPAGSNNLAWISLTFQVPEAGQVGIYVAASADENPGWAFRGPGDPNQNVDDSQDDDLRMVLDSKDYGWQTDSSWYGNRDFGEVKTVLLLENLSAGSHTLTFYANNTPTLYRVVIYSEKGDQPLPVQLTSFQAEARDDGIHLKWVTQSEVNNLGFNLYRAQGDSLHPPPDEQFQQINLAIIQGAGNTNQSHQYEYVDLFVEPNQGYWYKLEDISFSGIHTFHGPIWVKALSVHSYTFQLYPNYPNPFNPYTWISFTLPQDDHIRLEIYNLQGQRIRVLVEGNYTKGFHRVQWDGTDDLGRTVPAGVYYYRLISSQRIQTRKMVFMR